jgi:hypothetical protein
MKRSTSTALALLVAALVASGCATTNITTQPTSTHLDRPGRIIVYPFATTPGELRHDEQSEVYAAAVPPSSAQVQAGRQLADAVAARLIENINAMGMTAVLATTAEPPRLDDIVIDGRFESIDEGNAAKRVAIGFGSGKAEVRTVVVGYVMTENGLQRVAGATVDSGGGKGPGLFIPILVTAATANPIGLVVTGAAKIEGEASGRTKIEGAGRRTADAIAEKMKARFEREDWI